MLRIPRTGKKSARTQIALFVVLLIEASLWLLIDNEIPWDVISVSMMRGANRTCATHENIKHVLDCPPFESDRCDFISEKIVSRSVFIFTTIDSFNRWTKNLLRMRDFERFSFHSLHFHSYSIQLRLRSCQLLSNCAVFYPGICLIEVKARRGAIIAPSITHLT